MFLFLSKKNTQNLNKSVTFCRLSSFQERLANHFPKLSQYYQSFDKENAHIVVGQTVCKTTAINAPDSFFSQFCPEKPNENVLLGELGKLTIDSNTQPISENCTSLDQFAQKTYKDFVRMGGDLFSQLDENFLLAGWRGDEKCLHIATSPLSSRSIYWVEEQEWALISTDLMFIKAMLNKPLRLSERGLSSWLSGYPNPAISLFEDINVLPIGYRLELSTTNKSKIIKFWDIDPKNKIHFDEQSGYSEHFTDVLGTSVANACQSNAQCVASQMSGGLDSTSITALAKTYLGSQDKHVLPLSHIYTQSEKCDEGELVQDMLRFLDIEQSIQMTVDEGEDRDFVNLYPSHLESPGTVLSPRYIKELALVKESGADVLLTGNGGDEICWGHSTAYTQRLKSGDWRVVNEVINACSAIGMSKRQAITNLFLKPFVPELVLKMLTLSSTNEQQSMPIWLTDKAKALSIEETFINNPFDAKKDPVGYNRYQSLKTTSTYNAVRSYEKVSQQFGIDVRHPFFNKKVAEFSFAVPDKQLIQGPYPKWLLRHSMQHQLPHSVCWNLKKTTFDQHFGNLVRENASDLREILQDTRFADMGLINQSLLLAEFDRVVADPNLAVQVDLLYAILTFSWLKTHFPV